MFQKGEKVVFVLLPGQHPDFNSPKDNEVVTIAGQNSYHKEGYDLLEYPFSKSGMRQCCHYTSLRKLSEVSGELSEEIMEKVLTSIPELV